MAKSPPPKKAVWQSFDRRSNDEPLVPAVAGVNFETYQAFARDHLGFEFNNIDLLVTALTHRSYVNEHRKSTKEHNERLEFLGDAVLGVVVTEHLFNLYPDDAEGLLAKKRAAVVNTYALADVARELNLGAEMDGDVDVCCRGRSAFFRSACPVLK